MSLLGDIKDVGAAVFEVGKAAKGLIGNADKLAGGVKGLGSLFQRFSTAGRLAELARLGRKLSEYGDDALRFLANPEIKKFLKRAKTPILFGGQMTISGMKLTTGAGSPDDGARFGAGASRFAGARDTLAGAYPNGSWTGSGSESYSDSNSRQIDRTQTMVASDQSINAVLAREAGQITATRAVLDDQSDWLADVGLVTMLVAATPFVGQGAALAMEIAAVTKALGACTMQLTELTQQVSSNAAEISQTAGRYGERSGRSGRSTMSKKTPDPNTPPPSPRPSGEEGDAAGDGDTGDKDTDTSPGEAGSDRTQPEGAGTGGGSGSGTGSGGGSSSGGTSSGDGESADTPPAPDPPDAATPTSPVATGSPASGGGAAPGSLAAPLSNLPGAAVGAMPAAAAAGMSAAQIASLVQSAVQKAMQEQAAKEEAEKEAEDARAATTDTDGDGIPDVEEDENGDGIPDVEQHLEEQDADGAVPLEEPGAAPGAADGGRAPVHLAVDVDPAGMASPITATLDRNDPIGSPSLAQQ
ncbi:MAG TPA: EspA/EspE family type VII secretion system effector [Mycobacterium sp.]|nr:EspA/EspE family type VII secretion system effector [Mycobacterium sp.]